ncbi:uncharacterized protein LOC111102288 isoform X3 [Crassostrea virginica]
MIFIMALTMCTLPLLVFEMISVLNGFAKAAPVNCSQFHFLGKCNSHELSVCSANSWIHTTFTEIKQTFSEFDTFSKICSCNVIDPGLVVNCTNGHAYDMIHASLTMKNESLTPPTDMCPCECGYFDKISYWNLEENQLKQYNELNQTLAQIKRILKIETKNISSYRRKKRSADDKRPSARFTGYFGAFVMTLMFGGILLLDLPVILRQIQTLSRYIRRTCFKK